MAGNVFGHFPVSQFNNLGAFKMKRFFRLITLFSLLLVVMMTSCELGHDMLSDPGNTSQDSYFYRLNHPTNNLTINDNPLTVRGIVTNLVEMNLHITPLISISTNTFPITVTGNEFLGFGIIQHSGYYYIWISGKTLSGKTVSSKMVFFRYENVPVVTNDTTPPQLTINSPTQLQTVGSPYTISGTMSDSESGPNEVYVSVDGGAYTTTPVQSGNWSQEITLDRFGYHTNSVYGTDHNGNSSITQTVIVNYEEGIPSISVTTPLNGIITNCTQITFTGTASVDASTTIDHIEVNVNGVGYSTIPNTTWTHSFALNNGTNTFRAKAVAGNGNSTESAQYIVIQDRNGPVVTVMKPAQGSVLTQDSVLFNGTVSDDFAGVQQVKLSLNGAAFENVSGTDTWAVIKTLSPGIYYADVFAIDTIGNSGNTNRVDFTVTNIQSEPTNTNGRPVVSITPVETTHQNYVRIYISATDDEDPDPDIYFTTNGSEPTTGSIPYTAPFTATSSVTVKAIAVDSDDHQSEVESQSYTVNEVFKLYYEKPSGWSDNVCIHHWDSQDSDGYGDTGLNTTWPGDAMTDEGNGWYSFTFSSGTRSWLMFVDGDNTSSKTVEMQREGPGWYSDGIWYDFPPYVGQAPTLSASPAGGWISNAISVTLGVSGENVTASKYTLNGSDPAYGTSFTDGQIITVGEGLSIGEEMTLRLYAKNIDGVSTESYTYVCTNIERPDYEFSLGAVYTPQYTTFAIWSPDSGNVKIDLNGTEYTCVSTNVSGYSSIYYVKVSGDHKLKKYQFKINGSGVRDPYGRMVASDGKNVVMDLDSAVTDPEGGWVATPVLNNREDAIIYEVHVRDFTLDSSSGVDANKRGKYLGMVQSGTTYNSYSTGIDHLLELGVTHVQLLPTYDFYTGQYNWGYDPWNYNVPEEQYSMYGQDEYEARIKEYKTMINEFHKAGIRVIVDVVYNHTFNKSVFEGISSQYYHSGDGLSGCGNSVNDGVEMVDKFILDSLEYWVEEYNVDGFRFDLIGIFYYNNVREWGEALNSEFPTRNLLIYGEPWNGYATDPNESMKVRYGNVPAMASGHVGVFNGGFRENIKGNNDGDARGWMFGVNDGWGVYDGIRGSLLETKSTSPTGDLWGRKYCYDPEQTINYISAHDNYCLWDKIKHCGEDNEYGKRVDKFGMGIVFTSQGLSFIHAGDEMLRTKVYSGDWTYAHNSYSAPDNYNKIFWSWKQDNYSVFTYYRDFIALRKAHPALRMTTWDDINTYLSHGNMTHPTDNLITANIKYPGDELFIVYNNGANTSVSLPSGNWKKIADINGAANQSGLSGSYTCEGTAVTVFEKQ